MTQNIVKETFEQLVQNELLIEKNVQPLAASYNDTKISVSSLFCGAGGCDLGVEWAGLELALDRRIDIQDEHMFKALRHESIAKTVYALDYCKEAVEAYKSNFQNENVQHANIRQLSSFPSAELQIMGFPCPGFSSAGPRNFQDERNYLYVHCCRALKEAQPKFFVAENVPGLLTLMNGEVFEQIKLDFQDCGYKVYWKLINARDYGCAQIRERVILVGVRDDIDYVYTFPEETHGEGKQAYVTLQACIGDLESTPGSFYEGSYSSQYMSRNRKKEWHEQSFTIQASARQAPLHPSGCMQRVTSTKFELVGENRRLSVRESARIQSFPDWFQFEGGNPNVSHNTYIDKQFKQVGNAVPPLLMKCLVKPILSYLRKA